MWKSRENLSPPPNFWADFVANVNVLFPGASLDKATLDELHRLVVDEWRNGTQVHLIVRQLCSCDGRSVVPSEGARRRLGRRRGIARAPQDAVAGQVFGVEDLRDPAPLARLLARQAMLEARIRSERNKKLTEKRQQTIEALSTERADVVRQISESRQQAYWSRAPALSEEFDPEPEQEEPQVAPRRERKRAPKKEKAKRKAEPSRVSAPPKAELPPPPAERPHSPSRQPMVVPDPPHP